jgi:acetylglutamate kinase
MTSSNITVVKLGGSIFDTRDTTIEDVVYLQKQGRRLILVHGGANLVTKWLKRQNNETKFFQGERVTDRTALEMVTAVLAGLANKETVAAIIAAGGRAVGISGVDGALVQGKIRNKEMGYVGDIVRINQELLLALLDAGFIPVVAPVSLHSFDRPAGAPLLLNMNGDTVAGEIAAAIGAEKLIFLTDVDGIRDQSGEFLPKLSPVEVQALLDSGVASGGMIPKLKACLRATTSATICVIIDGRKGHALTKEIEAGGCGTTIRSL